MTREIEERICSECGARLEPGAEVCDLCGTPVGDVPGGVVPESPAAAVAAEIEAADTAPYCHQCGWKNPPGARFCSMCGTALQAVATTRPATPSGMPRTPQPASTRPPAAARGDHTAVNRQVGILVGAGVLIVVALYLLTVVSKDLGGAETPLQAGNTESASQGSPQGAAPVAAPTAPDLPPALAQQVAALEDEIEGLEGEARITRRQELVNLLIGGGQIGRAAQVQGEIAEEAGTPAAWTRAGNLYYDWMETLDGQAKVSAAQRAVDAYQKVLEQEPDNLNVRTDMAWAYQYDPRNPMEAINQTNYVLQQDPEHVQANFNKGIFLWRINRADQAIAQFEQVKTIVGEGDPIYEQANAVIRAIREFQSNPAGS